MKIKVGSDGKTNGGGVFDLLSLKCDRMGPHRHLLAYCALLCNHKHLPPSLVLTIICRCISAMQPNAVSHLEVASNLMLTTTCCAHTTTQIAVRNLVAVNHPVLINAFYIISGLHVQLSKERLIYNLYDPQTIDKDEGPKIGPKREKDCHSLFYKCVGSTLSIDVHLSWKCGLFCKIGTS
jgi:hypothetical protein